MPDSRLRELNMMLPKRTDLRTWASSLIVDFPNDNIPILKGSDDWKTWGSLLVEVNSFASNGAPNPRQYSDVGKWMEDVFKSMANF